MSIECELGIKNNPKSGYLICGG